MKELENLRDLMRVQSLDSVFAEYDGSGDSGAINNVGLYRRGQLVEDATSDVTDVVYDAVYALLEEKHAGWEINDGADGGINFSKQEDGSIAVNWQHRQFYVASDDVTHEFNI